MTTIVWDGKTLAADRRVTSHGMVDGQMTKIVKRKKDGALAGGAGSASLVAAFHRWFLKGERGKRPELKIGEFAASCVIIRPDKKIECHDEIGWFQSDAANYATGSGFEVAYGALGMGASARTAVQVAAERDTSTGLVIETLELGK